MKRVEDLIAELQQLPPEAPVNGCTDYDATWGSLSLSGPSDADEVGAVEWALEEMEGQKVQLEDNIADLIEEIGELRDKLTELGCPEKDMPHERMWAR